MLWFENVEKEEFKGNINILLKWFYNIKLEEEDSWNTKLTEWKFKRKEDLGKKSKREEKIW